jgi:UDP-N-acetylmuramate--alanine ligase
VVWCTDDPGARRVLDEVEDDLTGRGVRSVSYGASGAADLRLEDVTPSGGGVGFTLRDDGQGFAVRLQVPGAHNALNAAAAYAAATCLGFPSADVVRGLAAFGGTRRRFEFRGEAGGIRVYDDYAHHPTEVDAILRAARPIAGEGRLVVAFQPHLFSRTRIFAQEFGAALGSADEVLVLDVYPAREDPEPGVTGALIADAVPATDGGVDFLPGRQEWRQRAVTLLGARLRPGDLLLTVGAGDVTELGPALLESLRRTRGATVPEVPAS